MTATPEQEHATPATTKTTITTTTMTTTTTTTTSMDILTQTLDFISNANNETLAACLLGLAAVTYLVLGRLGLLLIGLVCGAALQSAWEGHGGGDQDDQSTRRKRRKESGLDVAQRLLRWSGDKSEREEREQELAQVPAQAQAQAHGEDQDKQVAAGSDFDGFRPETKEALQALVDAVLRDHVRWWYSPIVPDDEVFPQACRQTLTSFLRSISSHLARKRPADTFVNFLINTSSIVIVFLSELSAALMVTGGQADGVEAEHAVQMYLATNPESNLANVLSREQQEKKLMAVADDILHTFLDKKSYESPPVKTFLQKILATVILESILAKCSKPEWINGWIVYMFEESEPELMNAIDAGVGGASAKEIISSPLQEFHQALVDVNVQASEAERDAGGIDERLQTGETPDGLQDAMVVKAKRLSDLMLEEELDGRQSLEDAESSTDSNEPKATPTSSLSDIQHPKNEITNTESQSSSYEQRANETTSQMPASFTNFDQLVPPARASVDLSQPPSPTLLKARVTIFDDAQPGDKGLIRSKPTSVDYLLQIEPASSQQPGWMIARKYADFETLHEVLRRISVISGVPEFTQRYSGVPSWKNQTKTSLRTNLEAYLREALLQPRLAESEGMKRFLEKDQALDKLSSNKGVLGFPTPEAFQTMGKGMLDVLTSAPKGAAGGGKALFEGVTGVLGVQKKGAGSRQKSSSRPGSVGGIARIPRPLSRTGTRSDSFDSTRGEGNGQASLSRTTTSLQGAQADDAKEASPEEETTPEPEPPALPARPPAPQTRPSGDAFQRRGAVGLPVDATTAAVGRSSQELSREGSVADGGGTSQEQVKLPPLPHEISDTYDSGDESVIGGGGRRGAGGTSQDSSREKSKKAEKSPQFAPLNTQETQMAIELLFAVINELYTLSSVWNIRRTLLNAAKTFLLRPGNQGLESIRKLVQERAIEANTSDAGVAAHLAKLRENALPTPEEQAAWGADPTAEEKEDLRARARRAFVSRGMPPALTGVMGAAASHEALARVFDSLQIEEVNRGLIFALMLQGVRAVTH